MFNITACIINNGRDLSLTLESLCLYGIEDVIVIERNIDPRSEARLRNEYLKKLSVGQWFLSIDSDEVLMSPVEQPKSDFGLVKMLLDGGDVVLIPRLIRYQPSYHYYTHYLLGSSEKIYDVGFVQVTFNQRTDLPYVATIKHLRESHTRLERTWKELQRRSEKRVEKGIRKKGGVIIGFC